MRRTSFKTLEFDRMELGGFTPWSVHMAAESNGRVPELWWPDSGLRNACNDWKSLASGQTEMPVTLGPSGSVFVVFQKAGAVLAPIARDTFVAAETPPPLTLNGPWQVEFPVQCMPA